MLSKTPAAIKKRTQRRRQRDGLRGYKLYLPEASVVEAMVQIYGLPEAELSTTPSRSADLNDTTLNGLSAGKLKEV